MADRVLRQPAPHRRPRDPQTIPGGRFAGELSRRPARQRLAGLGRRRTPAPRLGDLGGGNGRGRPAEASVRPANPSPGTFFATWRRSDPCNRPCRDLTSLSPSAAKKTILARMTSIRARVLTRPTAQLTLLNLADLERLRRDCPKFAAAWQLLQPRRTYFREPVLARGRRAVSTRAPGRGRTHGQLIGGFSFGLFLPLSRRCYFSSSPLLSSRARAAHEPRGDVRRLDPCDDEQGSWRQASCRGHHLSVSRHSRRP